MNFKVIFEDNHIIVVEKQPNVLVQADKSGDKDMLTIIKEYLKEKYNKPGNVYLGLVHRLDRPVGGIMVFAKTSKAASRLSEQIRKNEFKKIYLTVVNGKMEKQKDTLENYLFKNEDATTCVVNSDTKGAKYAKLDYEVISYNDEKNVTLLKINLHTGRHHQIRVQLSNIGHTIYGDQRYGNISQERKQIALWANKIIFKHPTKDEIMELESIPQKIGIWNM